MIGFLAVPVRSLLCNFDHASGVLEAKDEVDCDTDRPRPRRRADRTNLFKISMQ
jgi:hypothetical protein